MTDTCILVAKGTHPSFQLYVYHGTIGLVWFYVLRFPNVNAAYFGAFLNSVVHSIMYLYYAYSVPLRRLKVHITHLQLMKFMVCLVNATVLFARSQGADHARIGLLQAGYMLAMLLLFGRFYSQPQTTV